MDTCPDSTTVTRWWATETRNRGSGWKPDLLPGRIGRARYTFCALEALRRSLERYRQLRLDAAASSVR